MIKLVAPAMSTSLINLRRWRANRRVSELSQITADRDRLVRESHRQLSELIQMTADRDRLARESQTQVEYDFLQAAETQTLRARVTQLEGD